MCGCGGFGVDVSVLLWGSVEGCTRLPECLCILVVDS